MLVLAVAVVVATVVAVHFCCGRTRRVCFALLHCGPQCRGAAHDGNEGLALLDRLADGSHEVTAGSDSLFIHPDIISCVGRAGKAKAHEAG